MSAPTTPACPLGLSADDLSAWRDDALAPAEQQRISAHVSGCAACQRVIAAHEALATAIHADQPPAPDPRAWPQLQARIAAHQSRRGHATAALGRAPRRAVWGGLGAAAAVLLLSALFLHLFAQQALVRGGSSHAATATVLATPQPLGSVAPTAPIAGPGLNWQMRMAPESVIPPPGNQTYDNGFAFSPTDAETAYICATTNAINAPNTIWATHDGARTWTHVSDIPYAGEVADCVVTVDAADPMRLSVMLSQQGLNYQSLVTSEISDDGGKTWRIIGANMMLEGLETQGDVSVALVMHLNFNSNPNTPPQYPHLSVSRDDWRTWEPIDGSLAAEGYIVNLARWRLSDGALLVAVVQRQTTSATPTSSRFPSPSFNTILPMSLWQSTDLGAHWSRLPMPPNLTAATTMVIAQPSDGAPWKACGLQQTGSGSKQGELIGCTVDGGRTWQSRPLPSLKSPGGSGTMLQDTIGMDEAALLSDGSLIAIMYGGPQNPNVVENLSMFHIFRLPAGADQWQDLGSQPGNALVAIGAPAPGTLVSYSGGSSMDGYGGSLVGHLGGDIPNRGALAIATLP